jgi:short-subunit dehydrogenase
VRNAVADSRPFAVITGASSGIGRELARQFMAHGFDILVTDEDGGLDATAGDLAEGLTGTAGDQAGAGSGTIQEVVADLATPEGAERVVAAIATIGRPVDALALNAGFGNGGAFTDIPLADEQRLIAVNIAAPVHLAKRIVPDMVRRGAGRVLFTSSVASQLPGPYYATYAASKAFIQSFAHALRYELAGTGVTVTALLPGPTDTGFFGRAGMAGTPVGSSAKDDPATVARDGFEALMAGKSQVVAGSLKNKIQTAGARLMPEQARAAIHARMTKPSRMTKPRGH